MVRHREILPPDFYRRPAEEVARDLLGRHLVRELDGERLALRLVETEAYLGGPDRASHAWGGRRTARNESLYLPGGFAYVYFIYGMHYCLNAVTGEAGVGSAVLIRAGEPVEGMERMARLRGLAMAGKAPRPGDAARGKAPRRGDTAAGKAPRPGDLAGGPGKLCRALAIDRALDRTPLDRPPLWIEAGASVGAAEVAVGPRVGVDYAGEAAGWPLRFAVRGNAHVSRPRP